MSLTAGTRLGAYEIVAAIGAGGMGEVYQARDTRLERTVAIKVLPDRVASDPDLRQRFEREAKAISSLNHPHICTLYDVGSAGGLEYFVMEYLEGQTVMDRLVTGPMPLPQVLRYGIEIAGALDRAHRQGITHRDLKPGNIMLTNAGAKLLDFGLAKLDTPVQVSGSAATALPDLLTASGTILGTLQYMAPEQLEGKPVDHRADIFAFGAIVYEMATGKKASEGDSQASLIGAILRDQPRPISSLQPLAPPAFDALIATCLAKDPDDRWQSAGDLGRQLRLLQSGSSQPSLSMSLPTALAAQQQRSGWPRGLPFALTALVAAAVAGVAVFGLTRPAPPEPLPVTQFLFTPPADAPLANQGGYDVAISPDGRRIAYLVPLEGQPGTRVYVRELDDLEARAIPGTEARGGFGSPFFSADGRSIAFEASGQLMRVTLDGGPPLKIADMPAATNTTPGLRGGTWAADDTVIFANGGALYRVSAGGGGTPEQLTAATGVFTVGPVLLPGDRALLFGMIEDGAARVAVLDLETREQRIVAEGGENAAYSQSGHLIFTRGTTLMAQRFDLQRLAVTGEPVALLQGVRRPADGAPDFAFAANGTLVYVPSSGPTVFGSELVWVDRGGRRVADAVNGLVTNPLAPTLSPDGRRVAVTTGSASSGDQRDLWVYDLGGRPAVRLTNGGINIAGAWNPAGTMIAFLSLRGSANAYTIPADGSLLEPQAVRAEALAALPYAWSAQGELVLVSNAFDILASDADGGGEVRNVAATADTEDYPALSPDGRWLAYLSDRTGDGEIWVKRYPDGVPNRISGNGGSEPVWSRNGRELFYRQGDTMMAAAVDTTGETFSFQAAMELFTGAYFSGPDRTRTYDVAPDGRFLMIQPPGVSAASSLTSVVVVENWIEEVKRRVPVPAR